MQICHDVSQHPVPMQLYVFTYYKYREAHLLTFKHPILFA